MEDSPDSRRRSSAHIRGRRQRRLRRAVFGLTVVVAAAAIGGWLLSRADRPALWKPGEDVEEITQNLGRERPAGAPQPVFEDVTDPAGIAEFDSFAGERSSQLPEDMGGGLAWADFDNDGDDDLFLVSVGGALTLPDDQLARSRLYRNLGDGTFAEVDQFPELRIHGMAAAWGDYDGDGWVDLVVSGYDRLLLFHNREGEFEPGPELPAGDGLWAGVSWADFDADGDLDLYVCGYVDYVEDAGASRRTSDQYGTAVPYTLNPASFEPLPNLLLLNDGSGRFRDVAPLFGASNPEGRSLSALWHDFDADGRLDVYVANDISDNALYLNRGEEFEDAGLAAWVADYRGAMGLSVGDWNRDGDDDLFVTHWLAQENALYESRLVENRERNPDGLQRLNFSDVAAAVGVGQIALQMVGWGTEFGDFDSDGWSDLVVTNGSTLEDPGSTQELRKQPPMLLWNQQGEFFHDLAPLTGPLSESHSGRGLALADYDLDGDLDLAMVQLDGGVALLRNDTVQGNWLELSLQGDNGGRGEGAIVVVRAGGSSWRRAVTSASYLSQSSAVVHVGLGDAATVDQVEVRWPGGEVQTYDTGLGVNGRYRLVEGQPEALRLGSPASDRQRVVEFWEVQRSAMDAMKKDEDLEEAARLFRQALDLDPSHADSRYYLANSLAAMGEVDAALDELDRLRELEPGSHRAHKRWAVLRAVSATSRDQVVEALRATESAVQINQEETGGRQLLAELHLMLGDSEQAENDIEDLLQTNDRAVGGLFLRAYLAWTRGEEFQGLLEEVRAARGPDWKPEGAVAEGDVAQLMFTDETPLARFWQTWDGNSDATQAFRSLQQFLRQF